MSLWSSSAKQVSSGGFTLAVNNSMPKTRYPLLSKASFRVSRCGAKSRKVELRKTIVSFEGLVFLAIRGLIRGVRSELIEEHHQHGPLRYGVPALSRVTTFARIRNVFSEIVMLPSPLAPTATVAAAGHAFDGDFRCAQTSHSSYAPENPSVYVIFGN